MMSSAEIFFEYMIIRYVRYDLNYKHLSSTVNWANIGFILVQYCKVEYWPILGLYWRYIVK